MVELTLFAGLGCLAAVFVRTGIWHIKYLLYNASVVTLAALIVCLEEPSLSSEFFSFSGGKVWASAPARHAHLGAMLPWALRRSKRRKRRGR